jgi:hypothetical protein
MAPTLAHCVKLLAIGRWRIFGLMNFQTEPVDDFLNMVPRFIAE